MLEFADRFRLGRNGLIPVQVQVLLPISTCMSEHFLIKEKKPGFFPNL